MGYGHHLGQYTILPEAFIEPCKLCGTLVLSHVLHNFPGTSSIEILQTLQSASIPPTGNISVAVEHCSRILICEVTVSPTERWGWGFASHPVDGRCGQDLNKKRGELGHQEKIEHES